VWHDPFAGTRSGDIKFFHYSFICVTWPWHNAFIWVTLLMVMCDISRSYLKRQWQIHMCDMTHSYVWHDSFIHMCDMTHWYVWHDAFISVTWSVNRHALSRLQIPPLLIHMCDMTVLQCMYMGDMAHWYVWPYSFISVTWLWRHVTCIWVTWLIDMCDLIHDLIHS